MDAALLMISRCGLTVCRNWFPWPSAWWTSCPPGAPTSADKFEPSRAGSAAERTALLEAESRKQEGNAEKLKRWNAEIGGQKTAGGEKAEG